jgi:hypothetical protein
MPAIIKLSAAYLTYYTTANMQGLQLTQLVLPETYALKPPYEHDEDLANESIMIALKINGTNSGGTNPPPCQSILYLLHNLFKRDIIPKEIETLKDVRKFIAGKIQEARYTAPNDTAAQKFYYYRAPYNSLPDNFKRSFEDSAKKKLEKVKEEFKGITLTGTLNTIKDYFTFKRRNTDFKTSRPYTRDEGFLSHSTYLGLRALAIVDSLKAQIAIKKDQDRRRLSSCVQDNFDPRRVISNCKIGYYENDEGCCVTFPGEIVFSTNAPGTGAYTADVKNFEKYFLNLTYEGYSIKETVLIANIFEFLQNEMFGTIREMLNYQGRIRFNPNRENYGNFDCETLGAKAAERLSRGTVSRSVAGAVKDVVEGLLGTVLYTSKVALSGTSSLVTGVYRKVSSGKVNGVKLETIGDVWAAELITNIPLMFLITLSIYNEFVKLIIKQFIKTRVLENYTYDNLFDEGFAIKDFLLRAISGEQKGMTIAEYINLKTGDHSYEDFETEMELTLNTLGESISAAFKTIPGLSAVSKLVVNKVTGFIQKTCVQATLALHYKNTLGAWLNDANIEFHLKQIGPFLKMQYPQVYRKLYNIQNDREWASVTADLGNFSIEKSYRAAPEEAAPLFGDVYNAEKEISEGLKAGLREMNINAQPAGGAGRLTPSTNPFDTPNLGGAKHKKYNTKRRSRSSSKSKSKRARSKSAKKRSRSGARKTTYTPQK